MRNLWPFLLLIPAVMTGSSNTTRGIRNNNPGNIRFNHRNNWNGHIGVDKDGFVIFDKPINGIRAITKILQSYQRRGVVTLNDIISTWAPSNENDTNAYISHAERKLGIKRNRVILNHNYPELIELIIKHENGTQPYTASTINAGIAAANV